MNWHLSCPGIAPWGVTGSRAHRPICNSSRVRPKELFDNALSNNNYRKLVIQLIIIQYTMGFAIGMKIESNE